MNVVDIALSEISTAPWNANAMDAPMRRRLLASLGRFGLVQPLVVRRRPEGYETVAGAQRLSALRDEGAKAVPCVILDDLPDAEARVLSVALNRIAGTDDVNALGDLARAVLGTLPEEAITSVLPYSLSHLQNLASLAELVGPTPRAPGPFPAPSAGEGFTGDRSATPGPRDRGSAGLPSAWTGAGQAQSWERARAEAFDRVSFAFTPDQRRLVEAAVVTALRNLDETGAPNRRGMALAKICADWLAKAAAPASPTPDRVEDAELGKEA